MTLTLAAVDTLDRAALLAAWSDIFGSSVPKGLSQAFLRRFFAFEIQVREAGGLPKGFVAAINVKAKEVGKKQSTGLPKPDGRILREWNGVTHVVEITEDG